MPPDQSSASAAPLGIAVAGYGYWGPNLARVANTCAATTLEVVCDLNETARERAAKLHPGVRVTSEWEDVLNDDRVGAVIIALPVPMHFPYALDALRAGKHVLVEKPLTQTVAECDALIAEAARRGLILMAGHTFEYHAAVERVKAYLDSGELGEPYYVAMRRMNLGIVRSDSNAMWSLAPHDVSILCHWLDREPVSVQAHGLARLQEGIEDVVFMNIDFEGDVAGHVHCSWLNPSKVRDATLVGSKKMVVYDDVSSDEKVRVYDKGIVKSEAPGASLGRYEDFARFQLLARAGDVLIPKIDFREPLLVQIEHFAECIAEGREPRSGATSARRVVSVLEAAQRSLETGTAQDPRSVPAAPHAS
jgi:predicted dehydrogenase